LSPNPCWYGINKFVGLLVRRAVVTNYRFFSSVTALPALFRFREPASTKLLGRDPGQVGLDVENRRAVEHVDASYAQAGAAAA
jgi:hypothetical protein